MHPGAWTIWAGGAGIVALSTTDPYLLVPLGACAYLVQAVHRDERTGMPAWRVFVLVAVAAVAIRSLLVIFGGSLQVAFLEGLRLGILLLVFGAFNAVIDPFALLGLAPRRFYEPALAAALALSITPRTIAAAGRVREAQRLRGLDLSVWRSIPALAVPVLANGMEEALVLAESMDARGHGRGARSKYRVHVWSRAAWGTVLATLAGVIVFFAGGSDATFASFGPPESEDTSVVQLVSILGFALPGAFRSRT